jgi:MerR family mercuric resistance operon transcriptional regulator
MITRGKLAAETGCNIETIRHYENIGLMPNPPRSASGYRMYSEDHIRRLRFIQRARELGFPARRIRELLDLSSGTKNTRADVKSLTEAHIQEVSNRIKDLQKLKNRLSQISSHCDGSSKSAKTCPIIISLFDPK